MLKQPSKPAILAGCLILMGLLCAGSFTSVTQSVSQSGTWTVQPGNTANTTPWLMTINQGGNSATVSAAGNLNTAVNLALPAGTNTIGNVNQSAGTAGFSKILDTGGTNVAAVSAANALKVDGSAVTQPVSGTITANQGGTWTVQPGNTANTTAWKVDGSAVTQPVSGTVTATANQNGTWTVQPGNTANTTPWLMTINQGGNSAAVSASNALKVDGSAVTQPVSGTVTANAGASATGGYSFNHQAANTAGVTIKTGAGTLHTLILNNVGATDTITLYDNTAASGTVIAIINDAAGQGTYTFDCAFATGLEIVIAGTTAPDVTVTYK